MKPLIRRSIGICFWIVLAFWAVIAVRQPAKPGGASSPITSLAAYLAGPAEQFVVVDPTRRLRRGDPVFHQHGGDWRQIGFVQRVLAGNTANRLQIAWYDEQLQPRGFELTLYRNNGQLQDVIATMLPAAKRRQIQELMTAAFNEHGEELSAALLPLMEQTFRESLPIVEAEFRRSIARHRDEVDELADRLQHDVVQQRLIPLAKEEIVPIVRKHGKEPVHEIGRELWNRASLWRFGWRALYDQTPLPRRELVQEEWDRFVDEEALPVLEEHMDQIVTAVQHILADVATNPAVRAEMAAVAETLASDPQAHSLVRTILKEALVENPRLRQRWRDIWTSDQARAAISIASDRLEPVVRQIGDELFGTRETGINPNFARVLRNQILGKDRRWIVARRSPGANEPVIEVAGEFMPYPIVHLASEPTDGDG